jgi:rare lipoprotein A
MKVFNFLVGILISLVFLPNIATSDNDRHHRFRAYEGRASWYGPQFYGKQMANGDTYDKSDIFIAHRHLPLGTRVKIINLENGKKIIAEVADRGPYTKKRGRYHREIDLSFKAAKILEAIEDGIIPVKIIPLKN